MCNNKPADGEFFDGSEICSAEADRVWDEYKYRHDLIWRHIIRSVLAVIALLTVAYSTSFRQQESLFVAAAILAIAFSVFNLFVVNKEIVHYWRVKKIHRTRLASLFGAPREEYEVKDDERYLSGFAGQANVVLAVLLIIAVATAAMRIVPQLGLGIEDIVPDALVQPGYGNNDDDAASLQHNAGEYPFEQRPTAS